MPPNFSRRRTPIPLPLTNRDAHEGAACRTAPLKALRREKGRDGYACRATASDCIGRHTRSGISKIRATDRGDRLAVGGKRYGVFRKLDLLCR